MAFRFAWSRVRVLCQLTAALALFVSTAQTSAADIDAGGVWSVRFSLDPEQFADFIETWTQNGDTLETTAFNCPYSGTIDVLTGEFYLERPSTVECLPLGCILQGRKGYRAGTVSADGRTFTGEEEQCTDIGPGGCSCTLLFDLDGSRCGNGLIDAGEECDDGNRDDLDGCSSSCEVGPCSTCTGEPSVCTPLADGLDCDDGDECTLDDACAAGLCTGTPKVCPPAPVCQYFDSCRSSTGECLYAARPLGWPCNDQDVCTGPDKCNGSGGCVGPAIVCDDGLACTEDVCEAGVGCVGRAPEQTCAEARRSVLLIKDQANDSRDAVKFKWIGGDAASQNVGDPTSSDDYRFCLYAGTTSELVAEASIPAGAGWTAQNGDRYRYDDSDGTQEGVRKVLLRASSAGKGKIVISGKGENLSDAHPPLALPLSARVTNESTQACWGALFNDEDVKKNETGKLKAKARTP